MMKIQSSGLAQNRQKTGIEIRRTRQCINTAAVCNLLCKGTRIGANCTPRNRRPLSLRRRPRLAASVRAAPAFLPDVPCVETLIASGGRFGVDPDPGSSFVPVWVCSAATAEEPAEEPAPGVGIVFGIF